MIGTLILLLAVAAVLSVPVALFAAFGPVVLIVYGVLLLAVVVYGLGIDYYYYRKADYEPIQPTFGDHPLRSWERRR
jgi:predicted neutral ceramidase superfamily lipid hydrolase